MMGIINRERSFVTTICVFGLLVSLLGCGAKHTDLVKKTKGDARSFIQQGNEAYREGRYEAAARYYDRARIAAVSIDDLVARADADNNTGHLFLAAGDYKNARRKFDEAIRWAGAAHYDSGMAAAKSGLGMIFLERDEWDSALACFNEALELAKEGALRSAVYSNIGELERRRGNSQLARRYLKDAIEGSLKSKKHMIAAMAYYRMALVERGAGDVDSALFNARIALEEDKKVEHSPGIVKDLELLSELHEIKGNAEESASFKRRHEESKSLLRK